MNDWLWLAIGVVGFIVSYRVCYLKLTNASDGGGGIESGEDRVFFAFLSFCIALLWPVFWAFLIFWHLMTPKTRAQKRDARNKRQNEEAEAMAARLAELKAQKEQVDKLERELKIGRYAE